MNDRPETSLLARRFATSVLRNLDLAACLNSAAGADEPLSLIAEMSRSKELESGDANVVARTVLDYLEKLLKAKITTVIRDADAVTKLQLEQHNGPCSTQNA